jgi:hypothetical protein
MSAEAISHQSNERFCQPGERALKRPVARRIQISGAADYELVRPGIRAVNRPAVDGQKRHLSIDMHAAPRFKGSAYKLVGRQTRNDAINLGF